MTVAVEAEAVTAVATAADDTGNLVSGYRGYPAVEVRPGDTQVVQCQPGKQEPLAHALFGRLPDTGGQ